MKKRNIGEFVTPIEHIIDEKNFTKVEHRFKIGEKLIIREVSPFVSADDTLNYWCESLDSDKEEFPQMMNEKEIVGYGA